MPELLIHILNYRTPDLTLDCLKTLAAERSQGVDFEVRLLDNASGDDSAARIRAAIAEHGWGDWVHFEVSDRNLGFAGGNNHLIRAAMAMDPLTPYQLLLNSDTRVHPGCLAASLRWMRAHPHTGAFSCMLRNADGSVQNVCRKFPRPDRETVRALGLPYVLPRLFFWADLEDPQWDREGARSRAVEWIGGAFMLLPSAAIREAGVMDESFFFYGEDTEWCFRLHRAGWDIHFDAEAEITHLGGGSSDATRLRDRRKEILIWRARFQVQRRCYGAAAMWWVRGVYIFAFALRAGWLWLRGRGGSPLGRDIRRGLHTLTHPLDPDRV